jgi:hypothetical protein
MDKVPTVNFISDYGSWMITGLLNDQALIGQINRRMSMVTMRCKMRPFNQERLC